MKEDRKSIFKHACGPRRFKLLDAMYVANALMTFITVEQSRERRVGLVDMAADLLLPRSETGDTH